MQRETEGTAPVVKDGELNPVHKLQELHPPGHRYIRRSQARWREVILERLQETCTYLKDQDWFIYLFFQKISY